MYRLHEPGELIHKVSIHAIAYKQDRAVPQSLHFVQSFLLLRNLLCSGVGVELLPLRRLSHKCRLRPIPIRPWNYGAVVSLSQNLQSARLYLGWLDGNPFRVEDVRSRKVEQARPGWKRAPGSAVSGSHQNAVRQVADSLPSCRDIAARKSISTDLLTRESSVSRRQVILLEVCFLKRSILLGRKSK